MSRDMDCPRTDIHVADYGDLRSDELYGYARCIHDINDIGIPIGFQQIYFKKQNLKRLLNDYRADGEAYYIVEDGRIIISTDPDQEGKAVSEILPNLKLDEEYSSQQMKVDGTPRGGGSALMSQGTFRADRQSVTKVFLEESALLMETGAQ